MKDKLPHLIIFTGAVVVLLSLFADWFGWGEAGIQAAQVLGAEAGAGLALLGIALKIYLKKRSAKAEARGFAFHPPAVFWAALAMLPPFLPFLVAPMFFDGSLRVQYPEGYIPKIVPIGTDLRALLDALQAWFGRGELTWAVFAPPTLILFAPLLLLGYPKAYYFIVVLTLFGYIASNWLAGALRSAKDRSAVVFIASISMFAYGLQFELERGQTHTLALTLALLAVFIFYQLPDYRLFAYILLSVSIQLKFYPALLAVLLIEDWRDWKSAARRIALLGLANFALFFLLGFSYFSAFLNHMLRGAQDGEVNLYNHSIRSFVSILAAPGIYPLGADARAWIQKHAGLAESAAYLYFLLCFAWIAYQAYRRNRRGIDADLLLACVVGGMTLPSVNHDYTLPLLTAPFALSFSEWLERESRWGKAPVRVAALFAAFAYSLTLFPPDYKPLFLQNSFPMIFSILTVAALLSAATQPSVEKTGTRNS